MTALAVAIFDTSSIFGVVGPIFILIAVITTVRSLRERNAFEGASKAADVWRINAEAESARRTELEERFTEAQILIEKLKHATDLTEHRAAMTETNVKLAEEVEKNSARLATNLARRIEKSEERCTTEHAEMLERFSKEHREIIRCLEVIAERVGA